GQTAVISAAVLPPVEQDSWLQPGGAVTLREGNDVRGSTSLRNASATFAIDSLPLGDHSFIVEYAGDGQYEARQSPPLTMHVTTATTTTKLTADPPAGIYGREPRLTVNVTSSKSDTPSGPIRLTIDGNAFNPGTTL